MKEIKLWRMDELMRACHREVTTQQRPRLYRGEWYCENTDCEIREVHISAREVYEKIPDNDKNGLFKCPLCRHKLKFHHYTEVETWLPPKEVEQKWEK